MKLGEAMYKAQQYGQGGEPGDPGAAPARAGKKETSLTRSHEVNDDKRPEVR